VTESELLNEGETVIGRYNVEIARMTHDGRLTSTVPTIFIIITEQRMILQPQTRKRYAPAIIHGHLIKNAHPLKANRSGTSILLKNNYQINLFVTTNLNQTFINQVRRLASLPPIKDFALPLSVDALTKLITYLEQIVSA